VVDVSPDRVGHVDRADWPFPPNEFVRASRLRRSEATDEDVRRAVERVEDGGSR
jgi:hypothetical protein